MGRICAWCGVVLRASHGGMPASHAICGSCFEELQAALARRHMKVSGGAAGRRLASHAPLRGRVRRGVPSSESPQSERLAPVFYFYRYQTGMGPFFDLFRTGLV